MPNTGHSSKGLHDADLYHSAHSLQVRDNALVVNFYRHVFKKSDVCSRFLDIGCGTGDVTRDVILPSIEDPFEKIVATDVSTNMIRFAAEQDLRHALENIKVLLTPNGECLFTFLIESSAFEMNRFFITSPRWASYATKNDKGPYMHGNEKTISKLFVDLDFQIHSIEALNLRWNFSDETTMMETARAVCTVQHSIKPEDEIDFRKDLQMLLNKLRSSSDKLTFTYKLLVIHAAVNI